MKYIVAFEIGSSCIKGAIATTDPADASGRVNILAVETEPLVDKVRYGCVENPGDVASCVTAICHRLQQAPGVPPRVIKETYVGISGRSLASVPYELSRDFHTEIEVTRRVIDELMVQASTYTVADKEIVAVEPGTFSIDSQVTAQPVGMLGHVLSANVSLVACKPKIRNNIKRVINERCALNIAGYVVTPLAMGRHLLTVEERRLGVMLVDCGAETTTVAIYRDGVLAYLATIPMGSRNITRDITSLNCLEERAEEIKKAVGNATPPAADGAPLVTDGLDNSEINNIVAARADEIVSNIFEQITYAGLKPEQLPAGIVVTGGGARLRGFIDLLSRQTHMKTRQATVGAGVSITGTGFNPREALDVISIIAEAAVTQPVECTLLPPQMSAATTTGTDNGGNDNGRTVSGRHDDSDDSASRIGILDDDRDDNDDILKDDPEPDQPAGNTTKQGKQPSKPAGGTDTLPEGRNPKFWESLKQKLGNMWTEEGDFEN